MVGGVQRLFSRKETLRGSRKTGAADSQKERTEGDQPAGISGRNLFRYHIAEAGKRRAIGVGGFYG